MTDHPPPPDTHSPGFEPPDKAIDIGTGHRIVYSEYKGETAGIVEWHQKPNGVWCCGWVAFRGSTWEKSFAENGVDIKPWDVVSKDPLTLTPSILCRACGNHGYIRNGRWETA